MVELYIYYMTALACLPQDPGPVQRQLFLNRSSNGTISAFISLRMILYFSFDQFEVRSALTRLKNGLSDNRG